MPRLPKSSAVALLFTSVMIACGGGSAAPAGPEAGTPARADAKSPAAGEPAPVGARESGEVGSDAAWLLEADGPCAAAVRKHLAVRGEPGLGVAARWLVRECEDKKWSEQAHECVAAAVDNEALVRCRLEEAARIDDAALAAGLIPKTGIPACDRYHLEWRRCMRALNPDTIEQVTKGVVMSAKAMRNADASMHKVLADRCDETRTQLREQFPQCEWSQP